MLFAGLAGRCRGDGYCRNVIGDRCMDHVQLLCWVCMFIACLVRQALDMHCSSVDAVGQGSRPYTMVLCLSSHCVCAGAS
jgi:hypothetical protein